MYRKRVWPPVLITNKLRRETFIHRIKWLYLLNLRPRIPLRRDFLIGEVDAEVIEVQTLVVVVDPDLKATLPVKKWEVVIWVTCLKLEETRHLDRHLKGLNPVAWECVDTHQYSKHTLVQEAHPSQILDLIQGILVQG